MTSQSTPVEPGQHLWHRVGSVAIVAVQLGLLFLIFKVFDLETQGYFRLTPLIFGGFIVHAALPMRFRMPFFLLLSFAAFGLLWEWNALLVLGVGLGLIGICHLPVKLWARVALLVVAGAVLTVVRKGLLPAANASWISTIMPLLGSIFMFRLIIYLYELQHEKTPATIWERLSYFFLLPNACFLLFPVIDYQTFRRTYYDTDAPTIYQKGVFWMFRGMTHLLVYRILYHYVVPNPTQVIDLWSYVLIAFGTYLLYLKVSGLFNIIVGTLGLFGFNLPETYHRFLLAAGFNDFWRRQNIYWKDFMMNIFYYPSFMRLRKGGMVFAIIMSTIFVFLVTWMLHSYQWFWLLGAFPLTVTDAIFWLIFGGLVLANSLRQFKAGKKGSLSKPAFSFQKAVVHAFKVLGMLIFISVLWSFWYSPTPAQWVQLIGNAGQSGPGAFALLGLILLALVGVGVAVQYANSRGIRFTLLDPAKPTFSRAAMVTSAGLIAILALGLPQTKAQLGSNVSDFIATLQYEHLTDYDLQQADRGYYDALMTTNSIMADLGAAQLQRNPPNWRPTRKSEIAEATNDIFLYRLIPSVTATIKDVPLTTNQWGMRDQNYTRTKPEGTFRIALLGASIEMAEGVRGDETFEAVTEARLNQELPGGDGAFARYEILNFSVSGYSAVQHLALMDDVVTFQPDMLVYTGHSVEDYRMLQLLVEIIRTGIELPDHLAAIVQRAGVDATMSEADVQQGLEPFAEEILGEQYRRIAARCREAGITPVWLFVPRANVRVHEGVQRVPLEKLRALAAEAGFVVLDIGDAFADVEDIVGEVYLAPWDGHPSVYGHQLLANRFYEELVENGNVLGFTAALNHTSTIADSTSQPLD